MNIINLTPHTITFVLPSGEKIAYPPFGIVARVSVTATIIGETEGIPMKMNVYGVIENLPEPIENTIFLVSSLVAGRCQNREDVFIPNEPVRDESGNIIGCKSLGRV